MEFAYTTEQEALRSDVRSFIKKELTPEIAAELDPETSTGDQRGLGPRAHHRSGARLVRGPGCEHGLPLLHRLLL